MSQEKLSEFVEATAKEFGIPGVAVGVLAGGQEFVRLPWGDEPRQPAAGQ